MPFCSDCGLERAVKAQCCSRCKKDFRYLTEVNAYPFMLCARRHMYKCLNSSPSGIVTVTESNISVEIFNELFGKYGKSSEAPSPPSSGRNSFESEVPSPTSISIATSSGDNIGSKQSTPAHILSRVVWKRWELDAICKFQVIDSSRAFGAGIYLPEPVGVAVLIPPLHVSHYSYITGEQKMTISLSYAFLNSVSSIFQPPDHCLALSVWGAPPEMGDPQGYIVDTVASYPTELKQNGVDIRNVVLESANAILESRAPTADPKVEEESKTALEEWAAKASRPAKTRFSRLSGGSTPSPQSSVC